MTRMAKAGATEAQVAAVSGHSIEASRRILDTYVVRTAAMADAAIDRLVAYEVERLPGPDAGPSPAEGSNRSLSRNLALGQD